MTVYLPEFFGGEVLDATAIMEHRWGDLDIEGFTTRNSRAVREPEIFACARELRARGYQKLGAAGYCFGGWAVLRLAAKEHETAHGGEGKLVDCIVCAHPSWVTKEDIEGVGNVPVQVLAPEVDGYFSDELKAFAFQKLVLERKGKEGVHVEWLHFPGQEHGCLTKGSEKVEGERAAMVRGKNAAVGWFTQWLGV